MSSRRYADCAIAVIARAWSAPGGSCAIRVSMSWVRARISSVSRDSQAIRTSRYSDSARSVVVAGEVAPAPAVPQGVVQQAGQPRRPGGGGEQIGVVGRLVEAHLGQLQGLVGGADGEVERGAAAGRGDHVVVPAGAAGVVRHHGRVGGAAAQQRVQRRLVQPAALPAEHLVGDRLAHQRVPERELVLAGLDQDAPGDQVAQHGDELVLARAGHRRRAGRTGCGGRARRPPRRSGG